MMTHRLNKTLLAGIVALATVQGAYAQRNAGNYTQWEQDTVKVLLKSGLINEYLNINSIDYTAKSVLLNTYTNGAETIYKHNWEDIARLSFANRYSSGDKIVSNLYYDLRKPMIDASASFLFASMVASDDAFGGGGSSDKVAHAIDFLTQENINRFSSFWNYRYEDIQDANNVIQYLPMISREYYTEDDINYLLGEAHFMRGYFYYELASMFNRIPVFTENSAKGDVRWSQREPAEVWGQILLDMRKGVEMMTPTSRLGYKGDDMRANRYAAEGMLARAYLFYLGYYMGVTDVASANSSACKVALPDGSTLTREDVVGYLKEVVEQSPYKLLPDYRNNWAYTNRFTVEDYEYTKGQGLKWADDDALYYGSKNTESLFKIKYCGYASWSGIYDISKSNTLALYTALRMARVERSFPFGSGWGYATVNPDLWSNWDDEDMRKQASVADLRQEIGNSYAYDGDWYQNTQYYDKKNSAIAAKDIYNFGDGMYSDGYIPATALMYYEEARYGGNLMQLGNLQPQNLLRLSDVMLMLSELTGDVKYMNQVRERAHVAPLSSYSLKALQEERRHELALEGVRWNDMRRWGKDYCIAALEAQVGQTIWNEGYETTMIEAPGSFKERYEATGGFWAIPTSAIQQSDYRIEQNPGWNVDNSIYAGWGQTGTYVESKPFELGKWMYSHRVNGGCIGTLHYRQGDVHNMPENPKENGIEDVYTSLQLKDLTKKLTGEEHQLASMEMTATEIIKYDFQGNVIGRSKYSYEAKRDDWRLGVLTCDLEAILAPYNLAGTATPTTFDVLAINDQYMMLVATPEGIKEGDLTTFWTFRHTNSNESYWIRLMSEQETHWVLGNDHYTYIAGEEFYRGPWGALTSRLGDMSNKYSFQYNNDLYSTRNDIPAYLKKQGVTNGDEIINSYMVLNMKDMTIDKYTKDDYLISSVPFSFELFEKEAYSGLLGYIHTEPGAIVCPYLYNNINEMPADFEIRSLEYELILTYQPEDNPNSPTYWRYEIRSESSVFTGLSTLTAKNWFWMGDKNTNLKFNGSFTWECTDDNGYHQGTYEVKHWNAEGQNRDGNYGTLIIKGGVLTHNGQSSSEFTIKKFESKTISLAFTDASGKEIIWDFDFKLTPEIIKLAGDTDEPKTWTWANDETPFWGNAGNSGNGAGYTSTTIDGMWWGIYSEVDLQDYTNHAQGDETNALKDAQEGSYMQIGNNGIITTYTADGEMIRQSTFDLKNYNESRPSGWELGTLSTAEPAILWPYSINEGGRMVTDFDLMYLDENHMTLVYTKGNGAGSWGEITFWRFESK